MPIINLTNACVLLRESYYDLQNQTYAGKAFEEIQKIKAFLEELRKKTQKTLEEKLIEAELSLLIWEHEPQNTPKKEAAEALKKQLKDTQTEGSVSSPTSKWQKAQCVAKDVIKSLSFSAKNVSNERIRQTNLLKKIENWLRKIEENEHASEKQDCFSALHEAFQTKAINLADFIHSLVSFNILVDGDMSEYQIQLERQFQGLSMDELESFRRQMESKEMISLATAFYAQRCIASYYDELPEETAYQDVVSLLSPDSEDFIWVKNKIINHFSKELTEEKLNIEAHQLFLSTGGHISAIISRCYSAAVLEIARRKQQKERVPEYFPLSQTGIFAEWPMNKKQEPETIIISSEEKQIIGNAIKIFIASKGETKLAPSKNISPVGNPPPKKNPPLSSETLSHYFGNIIHAAGSFFSPFNPTQFIDALRLFQTDSISAHQKIKDMDDDALKKLHENLKGEDVNNLVLLLRQIKLGSQKNMGELCQWLSIERANPADFNQHFQTLAGQLYDAANDLMQTVRREMTNRDRHSYTSFDSVSTQEPSISIEDYDYNNLTLREERTLTNKNAACIKQLLNRCDILIPEYKVKLTLWDRFYHFMYPAPEKALTRTLTIDTEYKLINSSAIEASTEINDVFEEKIR